MFNMMHHMQLLFIFSLYFFYFFFQGNSKKIFHNKYITPQQWVQIQKFIVNSETSKKMRDKINQVLYIYYDDWSFLKAKKFKELHKHKCYHISMNELYTYSNMGLIRAIKNYNGRSNFVKYAEIYVKGELYRAITGLHPITSVSKYERLKKTNITDISSIYHRQKLLQTRFLGHDEWLLEKLKIKNVFFEQEDYTKNNYDDYQQLWNKINSLKPFEKYLLRSKFNYFFEKQQTNKDLAEKFGYSEEYIRKTIAKSIKKIIYL